MEQIKGYARAQAQWEAMEDPALTQFDDEECEHSWGLKGRAQDGTAFYRCRKCGIVEEM